VKQPEEKKDGTIKTALALSAMAVLIWMVEALQKILSGVACPHGGENSQRVVQKFEVGNDIVKAFVNAGMRSGS